MRKPNVHTFIVMRSDCLSSYTTKLYPATWLSHPPTQKLILRIGQPPFAKIGVVENGINYDNGFKFRSSCLCKKRYFESFGKFLWKQLWWGLVLKNCEMKTGNLTKKLLHRGCFFEPFPKLSEELLCRIHVSSSFCNWSLF